MQNIKEALKGVIKTLYSLDFDPEITPSPADIDADYSTNAPLKLAKELHKSPMEIAEALNSALKEASPEGVIPRVTPPGFLNFTLDDASLSNAIDDLATNFDAAISNDTYTGKTVICEFSDPNPFKVLHVGHLYTSVVGDAISRLFEYAGAKVIRANFGGDVGLHVAKTMYILKQKGPKELTIEDIAECYVEGTAAYEDDEAARQEITKLNKEIYRINANNLHDTKVAILYWQGRELSYAYFKDFYAKIGLKFDKFYPESTVADLGLKTVKEQLKNGVYEKSNGAVVFDGEKFGLHTRVFINHEGVPTYEAKDVGLIFTKDRDYHFDKSVVITGGEQLEYMKVVLKSVEQFAPELVEKTTHLTHGLVKLPGNVKMSSRKGNFLKAVDVLNLVKDELKSEYNSEDETVSLAATKYAFLKYKMGGNIVFDPKESVKMTGNSGPYLLYSAVRAKKILQKGTAPEQSFFKDNCRLTSPETYIPDGPDRFARKGGSAGAPAYDVEGEAVRPEKGCSGVASHERNLAKKLIEYKGILQTAVAEMAPHKLVGYLYALAQEFSRFYEHCPVRGSDRELERLKLTKVYLATMAHGLNILNINVPEEM